MGYAHGPEITQLNHFPLQTEKPLHQCSKARAVTGDFAKPGVALSMVAMESLNVPRLVRGFAPSSPTEELFETITALMVRALPVSYLTYAHLL